MEIKKEELLAKSPLKHKFVARQPIFDRQRTVIGYELLFRSGVDNFFDDFTDQDDASSKTLFDSFLLFGMNQLTGGKKAFINFTRNVLLMGAASAFPRHFLVIELLETIEPDPEVLSACQILQRNGYSLALDDFTFEKDLKPFIDFLDIIKVDFLETNRENRKKIIGNTYLNNKKKKIKFLAEKVETTDDFNQAMDTGYDYFQGFFFSRPVVVSTKDIPSVKSNLLNLLNKIYQPEIKFNEIEQVIKQDVSLAYKLIRFINSPSFGLTVEIQSIMHALNLLGIKELRKWLSLVVLSQLSHDSPEELIVTSIIRARFCELIAENTGMKDRSSEFFLMGLFSLIDIFFERAMADILKELPLSGDIKTALLEGKGIFGEVLQFVKSYEKGDWKEIFGISPRIKLDEELIPELYFDTIVWANALKL
ncbi:MAG: HDOD domain-containing protein [bacterium]|nr:HDOD domain-containing protein [bacterium]